jgi:16S rRNA (cytidine1402-2'-O)-methyltransferase
MEFWVKTGKTVIGTFAERPGVDKNGDDLETTLLPDTPNSVSLRTAEAVTRELAKPLAAGLYLVATPIGNLTDITLRALAILSKVDVVYCEDTRHSRPLLDHYGIRARLKPYHDHNAEAERPLMMAALARGDSIALISDAGTPLVSDPGFKLVRDAAALGHTVISVPGPSAVLAALTSAGLPTDTFLFAGFLPPKQAARRSRLSELASVPATLVFFEAPQRVTETLADMADVLGNRSAVVARELTKMHEQFRRGTLAALAVETEIISKGEFVIVVGPPVVEQASDEDVARALLVALQTMSLKDASKAVASQLGLSKSRVYDLGLELKARPPSDSE